MGMQYGFKTRFSEHIMEDNIGQLICTDVILARDGVYEYSSNDVFEDGKFNIIELHRDWEDVKKLKFTLEGKPVVYYHPDKSTDITVDNIEEFKVGHAQNIRESKAEGYNVLIGDLFITKKDTIALVKSGKLREISLGYFYDVDDSNKNHIRQINMIAEHIAIVDQGRAGIAKILDSADEYILARVRPNGEYAFTEQRTERPEVGFNKWLALKKYGYYRFNQYLELDQASKMTLQTIGLIVKENPTGVFVVLDAEGHAVKAYYHGKTTTAQALIDKDYVLDEFKVENALDPYDIPDEVDAFEEKTDGISDKDIAAIAYKLNEAITAANKDFNHYGDNWRGDGWMSIVKLLKQNKKIVEAALGITLPKDIYDGEYLGIAESFIKYSKKQTRRAHDEVIFSLLVVLFNKEKSDMQFCSTTSDVQKFLKTYKKATPKFETVDELTDGLNEIEGVYAIPVNDFSPKIFVSKAINDDEVEVYVCETVEELNKEITEYFTDLDVATNKINTKEDKYSVMSALRM